MPSPAPVLRDRRLPFYDKVLRIGIHTSIAGSLEKAALKAVELGANTFQIFSASPRMWKAGVPRASEIRLLENARARHDLTPLVIHDNYLINLASAGETIRAKSVTAFRGELERAIAIGAEYLVAHPGNYKGLSIEQGILNVIHGIGEAMDGLSPGKLMLLLENTVGAGAQLGSRFEELSVMREYAAQFTGLPIGFCLDTCHCLAAGYDVKTQKGLDQTIREAERLLGIENVRVIHANDSKAPLRSHIDRHEHIGQGYIGEDGFRRILTHPKLRDKAFILETPIDQEGDDFRNVETLKRLCRKSLTITSKSS